MEIVLGVIVGLIVLVFLVVAHEFGHAVVARRNGHTFITGNSDTDHGSTYILDSDFIRLYHDNSSFFPKWFKDGFKFYDL